MRDFSLSLPFDFLVSGILHQGLSLLINNDGLNEPIRVTLPAGSAITIAGFDPQVADRREGESLGGSCLLNRNRKPCLKAYDAAGYLEVTLHYTRRSTLAFN